MANQVTERAILRTFISIPGILTIISSLLIAGSFALLPWFDLIETQPSGLALLGQAQGGLDSIALWLVPLVALLGIIVGFWAQRGTAQQARAVKFGFALGIVGLVYYCLYFIVSRQNQVDGLAQATTGFWVALISIAGLVLQAALPRTTANVTSIFRPGELVRRIDGASPNVLLLPAVSIVLFLSVFPLLLSLFTAFTQIQFVRGGFNVTWVGLRHFDKMLFGTERRHFLGNFGTPNLVGWAALIIVTLIMLNLLWQYLRSPRFINRGLAGKLFGLGIRLFTVIFSFALLHLIVFTTGYDGIPGTLVVTFIFVIAGVFFQYMLGLGLAMLLTQNLGGKRFFRVMFLLPMMITPVGIGFLFRMLTDTNLGPFAPVWIALGLQDLSWVDTGYGARAAVLIGDIWQWTPFMFIILLAALEGVPREPIEAALVDGANRFQMFRYIILPSIIPVSTTLILIRMIEAFKIIDMPQTLTRGGPGTATESVSLHAYNNWRAIDLGGSAALAYLLLFVVTFVAMVYVNSIRRRLLEIGTGTERTYGFDLFRFSATVVRWLLAQLGNILQSIGRVIRQSTGGLQRAAASSPLRNIGKLANGIERRLRILFKSPNPFDPSLGWKLISYFILAIWTFVAMFPFYWLLVTAFKAPLDVNEGPKYIPFVDFQPSLYGWNELFGEQAGNFVTRPYFNTITVGLTSSVIALIIGAFASYALTRFNYRPKLGLILTFIGCVLFSAVIVVIGVPWPLGVAVGLSIFALLAQTLGRRFKRALGNNDIAFWMISQRMLPPVAVIIPIYILFQQLRLLNTLTALIITYAAINLPLVIWFMRDYFQSIPLELEESAQIDGASRFGVLFRVVLPLSLPGLVATFLIVLVFAWNEYVLGLFLSGADSQTMPQLVSAQNATRGPQWWNISVLVLLMVAPIVFLAFILERFIARGLLVGAVKG